MLLLSMAGVSSGVTMTVVVAAGGLLVWALAALLRAGLAALLELRGHGLDRWRRVWFHPEREAGRLLEALLVVAFVAGCARRYGLPLWLGLGVGALWGLHPPADPWSWVRFRRHPPGARG